MKKIKLSENLVLKLLSLALALTLWLYVQGQQPQSIYEGIQTFRNIEIEWVTDSGYIVTAITSRQADLTLVGSIDTVNLISSQDVTITLDLTGYTKGKHTLQLEPQIPAGVRIFSLAPQRVDVVLDNWIEKEIDVEINYSEALPDNVIIEEMVIDPPQVTVSGAEELINDVARIVVDYNYLEMEDEIVGAEVRAVNSSGVTLPNVSIDEFVNLSIYLNYYKTVPVMLSEEVEVPEDVEFVISPNNIVVKGSLEALEDIEYIETETFTYEDILEEEDSLQVRLVYPEGLEPFNEQHEFVDITIVN